MAFLKAVWNAYELSYDLKVSEKYLAPDGLSIAKEDPAALTAMGKAKAKAKGKKTVPKAKAKAKGKPGKGKGRRRIGR